MKPPVISGYDTTKTLRRAGFAVTRQKGSHVRLERIGGETVIKITVPLHKTLKKGDSGENYQRCGFNNR
jgi:predicted RNA binding protein YcfA (HicA-like mRNA interferase family)